MSVQTAKNVVSVQASRLTSLNIHGIAGRWHSSLPKKEHRITRSAREPRLEAVLYPASGSGSGPASRPSPRSSTPISRALSARTSHEHVDPWVVNNYTKFVCLRGSFGQCRLIYLCHRDPTNSQLSQLYYNKTIASGRLPEGKAPSSWLPVAMITVRLKV